MLEFWELAKLRHKPSTRSRWLNLKDRKNWEKLWYWLSFLFFFLNIIIALFNLYLIFAYVIFSLCFHQEKKIRKGSFHDMVTRKVRVCKSARQASVQMSRSSSLRNLFKILTVPSKLELDDQLSFHEKLSNLQPVCNLIKYSVWLVQFINMAFQIRVVWHLPKIINWWMIY